MFVFFQFFSVCRHLLCSVVSFLMFSELMCVESVLFYFIYCVCDSHVDLWHEVVSISDLFAVACKK